MKILSSDSEMEDVSMEAAAMLDSETPGPSSSLSPSPSLGSVTSSRGSVGRPRRSLVWDYFIYDASRNESVCHLVMLVPDIVAVASQVNSQQI